MRKDLPKRQNEQIIRKKQEKFSDKTYEKDGTRDFLKRSSLNRFYCKIYVVNYCRVSHLLNLDELSWTFKSVFKKNSRRFLHLFASTSF